MALWFTPPLVVPVGLAAILIAVAIYHAYANLALRPQAVAATTSSDTHSGIAPTRQARL